MQEAQHAEVSPSLQSARTNQLAPAKKGRVGRWKKGESGNPKGREKGKQNALTMSLREAVEIAAKDCHPGGLAGWLIERANGPLGEKQIFANMVGRVIPIQVNQSVEGGISINLNWLAGRQIGTIQAQAEVIDAQPVVSIEHSAPSHWTTNATEQAQPVPAQQGKAPGEENS
jgi:hypothetical protein